MTRRQASPDEADRRDDAGEALRKRAEEKVLAKKSHYSESWLPDQVRQALHELRVHQVELEMQNEELRQRQEELETSRAKYFDFYNLSPVGYFTISAQGLILEVNLTAANLLGMGRSPLLDQPFTRLIAAEDQDIYYLFHKQLFETGKPQTCELRMTRQGGSLFWARLQATVFEDTQSGKSASHIVVSDITELKQAEELLRESKLRFQSTFEQAAVGIAHVALDGHWLDVNQKLCDIVGYTREELLALTFQSITHPDDLELDLSYVRQLMAGEIPNFSMEKRYLRKGGKIVWVNLTVALVRSPGGDPDYFIGVIADITGRKLVEEKLRESEERFRTLVETADDAIILMDMDFNRIYENEASWASLGYTLEEWRKLGHWQERIHPDDIDLIKEKTEELFKAGASASKYRIRHKNGNYVTRLAKSKVIHSDGKPVAVLDILRDVTEMEMAEETLLQSERNYRQLTEQASEGIFVVDQKARYLDVNTAGLEMVGYSLEELRGMTIPDLMPPSELERAPSRFSEILSGKTIVSERTLRRKDGSLFLAEINAKLMPDGNVLATKRDITERKRRDEENTAHIRYLTSVNHIYRAFDPALDLETALPVALKEILSIFDCDRAFLLYPLDADAKTYKIPFEETKPEYPGAFTSNKELPVTREVAEIFQIALGASAPVSMNLVEGITDEAQLKEFDIKTQLVAPLYPKTGKPWMVGLHQCSRVREWTKEDQALFYAISLVISDKLNNLLLVRNLSESEERHRILFNNASVGIGISGEEGQIVAANEMLLEMLGYSKQEFMNMRLNELFVIKKDTDSLFERLSKDGEVHDFETVFRKKDGSEFEASLTVTLYNLGGQRVTQTMILDITERKKAEEDIRERMRHAEFMAEIGMALTESGSIRDALGKCCQSMVNNLDAAFARVWTFNETENMLELQASAGMYTHIDGGHSRVPVGKFKIGLIAQERKPHLTNQVVGDPRVGDQEWAKREGMVAFAGYPLVMDDKLIGVVAMFARKPLSEMTLRMLGTAAHEITLGVEHRIAEQVIKVALKDAELANKAKSVFLSSMSHEIRTPLTSVIGFSQLLASDAEHPLTDFQKKLLEKVVDSGNQLLELVNSSLDLAKIESGDIEMSIEVVDMKFLATMALTSSAHLAKERGVKLGSEFPADDYYVMADSILLRQVLTNLLSNAIKYNKKGGKTILSWKLFDENKIRISVSDEGVGISEDNIKNLYKPFDRLGMEGLNIKGFGVGLTIVKRLIESMGGEVAVESEVGKGSTFHIDLPGGKKRE